MTVTPEQSPTEKESEQWLAALASDPDPAAPPGVNKEAQVVRDVLQDDLESQTIAETDDTEYQRLLFRLRKEHLFNRKIARVSPASGWRRSRIWGVAASITLAVGLSTILLTTQESPVEEVYRGTTALIVDDPKAVATELKVGLEKVAPQVSSYTRCDGTVDLSVKASPAALDYLANDSRRILPLVVGDSINLRITPVRPDKCTPLGTTADWLHQRNLRLRSRLSGNTPAAGTESPSAKSTP
jgi:hypothetical protein